LAVGAAIAGYVLFSKPLERILTSVVRFDQQFNLRTAPAAVILAAVFGAYLYYRRREIAAEAAEAALAVRQAAQRADEMAQVVAFGRELTRYPDLDSIRTATATHLPRLVPGRRVWVMIRQAALKGHAWERLIDDGRTATTDCERAARQAVGEGEAGRGSATDDVCFPMVMANTPVCVLGVSSSPPLTELQRGVLSTAVALLASALKNAQLFTEIQTNSRQDGLTGCFNRTHALDSIDCELRRARRSRHTFSVVMFDIDTFKAVNDRFGHLCGDAVLAEVGGRMRSTLRTTDLKCRYGGDEFLVILPETPLAGAIQVCEALRNAIEKDPVTWADGAVSVTASFGVTEIAHGELDTMAVVARTDAALYRSKQGGRNRVTVAEPESVLAAGR
jgi:diguanylate cyclase (GGDEF)-like protein